MFFCVYWTNYKVVNQFVWCQLNVYQEVTSLKVYFWYIYSGKKKKLSPSDLFFSAFVLQVCQLRQKNVYCVCFWSSHKFERREARDEGGCSLKSGGTTWKHTTSQRRRVRRTERICSAISWLLLTFESVLFHQVRTSFVIKKSLCCLEVYFRAFKLGRLVFGKVLYGLAVTLNSKKDSD